MKKTLLILLPLLLSGCVEPQNSEVLSPQVQDCLDKGGEYATEWEGLQQEVCVFPDGSKCFAQDYNSEEGCYPEQTGKRELALCEGFEGLDVCTMQYDPVCAKIKISGDVVWQTFSNTCTACVSSTRTSNVMGYVEGACEDYAVTK